jgi:hypothetical protein
VRRRHKKSAANWGRPTGRCFCCERHRRPRSALEFERRLNRVEAIVKLLMNGEEDLAAAQKRYERRVRFPWGALVRVDDVLTEVVRAAPVIATALGVLSALSSCDHHLPA